MFKINAQKRGFTLIELIIVVAIIAIIVAAVFVAMDPVKRLNTSRNARRSSDAGAIAQAVTLYLTDKVSALDPSTYTLPALPTVWTMIGTAANCNVNDATPPVALTCTNGDVNTVPPANCFSIDNVRVKNYLPSIPFDPGFTGTLPSVTKTYYIIKSTGQSVQVAACNAQSECAGGAPGANCVPNITISR